MNKTIRKYFPEFCCIGLCEYSAATATTPCSHEIKRIERVSNVLFFEKFKHLKF